MKLFFLNNGTYVKITSLKARECMSTSGTFQRCCRRYPFKWKLIAKSSGKSCLNQEMLGFVVSFAPFEAKLTSVLVFVFIVRS